MIKRIALMGAGSLGTTLGAFLSKAGHDITLVDSYKEHVDALNKTGAHITGMTEQTIPVKACLASEMEGVFDLFIYMAKQTANEVAIPQMLAHSHDKTIIVACQNGIPEMALAKYMPVERIMGCPIGWGGIFQGPGCTFLTATPDKMFCSLGTVTGEITPELKEVAAILQDGNGVAISENLMGLRWCKLTLNACFSSLSTITGFTFGEIIDRPEMMRIICYLGRECVRTCAASGVKMEPFHFGEESYHFDEIYTFEGDDAPIERATEAAEGYLRPAGGTTLASMLQDIMHGRKTEVNDIPGAVCEAASQAGVEVPVMSQIYAMIKDIEDGKLAYREENAAKLILK